VTRGAVVHWGVTTPGQAKSIAARLRGLSRWPVVVAPMAGGPSTVELVVAAAEAGALGFLAGGYRTAGAMAAEMEAVRGATDRPFGVNIFVPGRPTADATALAAYLATLAPEATALGASSGEPAWDDDDYAAKVAALLAHPPALVSFTFGCPSATDLRALQRGGALVAVTVTTPEEAARAERLGADCLCLQGAEAGAHRGQFTNADRPDQDRPLRALLAQVRRRSLLPLLAAGGLAGPDDVTGALAAGATLVQLGTAFLACAESGAHPVYKAALADSRFTTTAVTRAFSGRRARSLVNGFLRDHRGAPAAYPEINNATRPLRAAAAASGDPDHMSLYAGEGFRRAGTAPLAQVLADLVSGLPG
jgi:nitronate monooxygenase